MANNNSDQFMMKIFEDCSNIYWTENKYNYRMISTGSNDLNMTKAWKDLIKEEIDNDLIYMWYTSANGLSVYRSFIRLYHTLLEKDGYSYTINNKDVCMTLGSTQATGIVFKYLAENKKIKNVALIGYSYSLFARQCSIYNLNCTEIVSNKERKNLPELDLIIKKENYDLYVLCFPTNPSGEVWSESEIIEFFKYIEAQKSYVILDLVAFSPITKKKVINIDYLISISGISEKRVFITNSFSKTDSVPAFRIGYLYGSEISKFAEEYQFNDIMNPPIFPVLPVVFTLIARLIYISEARNWRIKKPLIQRMSFLILESSFALLSNEWCNKIKEIFQGENFDRYYNSYITEQLRNEILIDENYNYLICILGKEINKLIKPDMGFNVLIMLGKTQGMNEKKFYRALLEKTYISILTQSCFSINYAKENFWIRISLAKPKKYFEESINRLNDYLSTL